MNPFMHPQMPPTLKLGKVKQTTREDRLVQAAGEVLARARDATTSHVPMFKFIELRDAFERSIKELTAGREERAILMRALEADREQIKALMHEREVSRQTIKFLQHTLEEIRKENAGLRAAQDKRVYVDPGVYFAPGYDGKAHRSDCPAVYSFGPCMCQSSITTGHINATASAFSMTVKAPDDHAVHVEQSMLYAEQASQFERAVGAQMQALQGMQEAGYYHTHSITDPGFTHNIAIGQGATGIVATPKYLGDGMYDCSGGGTGGNDINPHAVPQEMKDAMRAPLSDGVGNKIAAEWAAVFKQARNK